MLEGGASNSLKLLHADHLGSIVAASNGSGNLLERLRNDPWCQRDDGSCDLGRGSETDLWPAETVLPWW